jgi:hypothetical protein
VTRYQICGLTVASDRVLPELTPLGGGASDWMVRTGPMPRGRPHWFRHTYLASGRRWLSVARVGDRYRLRFARLASFEIDLAERAVCCTAARGVAPATMRHLLLDQVLPLLAGSPQRLALHASAVVSPRGAVAFLGAAGRGKSTIAALLAAGGWPLLSDDCLLIERHGTAIDALPAYPGVRLFPDSLAAMFGASRRGFRRVAEYTPKRRVAAASLPFARAAAPLARVYVLGAAGGHTHRPAVVRARAPRRAMLDIVQHALCLDIRDRTRAGETFHLAGAIVERAAMRALRLDWNLSRLDEIRDAVMADVMN